MPTKESNHRIWIWSLAAIGGLAAYGAGGLQVHQLSFGHVGMDERVKEIKLNLAKLDEKVDILILRTHPHDTEATP